jgi:hypothetical protein
VKLDSLLAAFKREVHDKQKIIDSDDEEDWYSLTLGWAIGKGLEPDDAHDFATHVRYRTDLG